MVTKSEFSNWMVDAYLEGRLDEIPESVLPVVRDVAERRNPALLPSGIERTTDASEKPTLNGWESVE
jgi:hypothetical protein